VSDSAGSPKATARKGPDEISADCINSPGVSNWWRQKCLHSDRHHSFELATPSPRADWLSDPECLWPASCAAFDMLDGYRLPTSLVLRAALHVLGEASTAPSTLDTELDTAFGVASDVFIGAISTPNFLCRRTSSLSMPAR
jgi:hypothetical protein